MKQLITLTALLLTLGVSTTFAKTTAKETSTKITTAKIDAAKTTGNGETEATFRKDFKHAELLSTEARKDYTKYTFKMNGAVLFAFYNENGELLAVTHNIKSTELPIQLLMQLKRDYSGYWISDLFEMEANDSNTYYITLENAGTRLTLRSNDNSWETYTKNTKN